MVKGRAVAVAVSQRPVGRRASGAAADARVSVETAWSNPHAQSTVRHLRRPVYLRVRHPLLVACPQQVDAPVDDHGDAAAAAVAAAAPPPRHAVAPVYTRRGIALDFMVDNDDEDPYDGVSYTDALARAAAIHTAQASTAQAAAQVAAASSSVASAGAASSPAPSAACCSGHSYPDAMGVWDVHPRSRPLPMATSALPVVASRSEMSARSRSLHRHWRRHRLSYGHPWLRPPLGGRP